METLSPSEGVFRAMVVLAVVSSVLAAVLPAFGISGLDAKAAELPQYSSVGALLTPNTLYWSAITVGAVNAIGLIGLLFFWGAARYLLVGSFVASVLLAPFAGVGIHSPVESLLGGVGSILSVWAATVSIWSPLAQRFRPRGVRT